MWVIIGFIKIKKQDGAKVDNNKTQKISVIIPVRNEEKNIISCLNSLQNQNYKTTDFEIIIINDHSNDSTEKIVNTYISKHDIEVFMYHLGDKTSKKEALKYGVEKSRYDIIATTDGDCILPINWLKNISVHIENTKEMLLGPVMFKNKNGLLSNFQVLDMLAIQGLEFGALSYQKPILNNAANLSYLKASYNEVKGFDNFNTPSGDDIFLLEKFKSEKKEVAGLLNQDFIVETDPENTFLSFLNQRLRWSSKSKYYSDKLLIYFSLTVLIQNISLILIYLGIPLVEKYRIILIILLFCKWLIDFILLLLVASFFNRKKSLFYFIPVQLLYPIYIIVVWIASMSMKFEWKGRKF